MEEREEERIEVVDEPFNYTVDGKQYVQRPLVLGQIRQLTNLLKNIKWPEKLDIGELIGALSDVMPEAFSIVLIEKGKESSFDLRTRDLKAFKDDLEFGLGTDLIIKVIGDFLSCNQWDSIWNLIQMVIRTTYIKRENPQTETEVMETGSTSTLSTSPEEIFSEETT